MASDPAVSVIIPVFGEQACVNGAIERIRESASGLSVEIIVVDGSPDGSTVNVIRDPGVKRLTSPRGRGRQMNEGAAVAHGDVLLFLHVDTTLPPDGLQRIAAAMKDGVFWAGAFDLAIAAEGVAFRIIERVATKRSRLTGIPYGDQAIFVRRSCFRDLGGYGDLPIMEDVDLMRRIKKKGGRIGFIGQTVRTSARRWQTEGILRCTWRNWTIILLYFLGVPPAGLAKWYRS